MARPRRDGRHPARAPSTSLRPGDGSDAACSPAGAVIVATLRTCPGTNARAAAPTAAASIRRAAGRALRDVRSRDVPRLRDPRAGRHGRRGVPARSSWGDEAPPPSAPDRPPVDVARWVTIAGFALAVAATLLPWSRFGTGSEPFGAWGGHLPVVDRRGGRGGGRARSSPVGSGPERTGRRPRRPSSSSSASILAIVGSAGVHLAVARTVARRGWRDNGAGRRRDRPPQGPSRERRPCLTRPCARCSIASPSPKEQPDVAGTCKLRHGEALDRREDRPRRGIRVHHLGVHLGVVLDRPRIEGIELGAASTGCGFR